MSLGVNLSHSTGLPSGKVKGTSGLGWAEEVMIDVAVVPVVTSK